METIHITVQKKKDHFNKKQWSDTKVISISDLQTWRNPQYILTSMPASICGILLTALCGWKFAAPGAPPQVNLLSDS